MNKNALCGQTPEYTKLTKDGKMKTGTEITINGETKFDNIPAWYNWEREEVIK